MQLANLGLGRLVESAHLTYDDIAGKEVNLCHFADIIGSIQ